MSTPKTRTEFTKKEQPVVDWYVALLQSRGVRVERVEVSSVYHPYRHTFTEWVMVYGKQEIEGLTYSFSDGVVLKDLAKKLRKEGAIAA
jgi:hypothetical protein